jgi:hypothetical protein
MYTDIFAHIIPGIGGVQLDVVTAAIALVGILVIAMGTAILAKLFLGGGGGSKVHKGDHGGDEDYEHDSDFEGYAKKRYKKELYERAYSARHYGSSSVSTKLRGNGR